MPWCNCEDSSSYSIQNINVDDYNKDIRCIRCGFTRSDKDVIILLLNELQDIKNKVMELDGLQDMRSRVIELERYKMEKEAIEWEEEKKIKE